MKFDCTGPLQDPICRWDPSPRATHRIDTHTMLMQAAAGGTENRGRSQISPAMARRRPEKGRERQGSRRGGGRDGPPPSPSTPASPRLALTSQLPPREEVAVAVAVTVVERKREREGGGRRREREGKKFQAWLMAHAWRRPRWVGGSLWSVGHVKGGQHGGRWMIDPSYRLQ
jgi:hypothetical protein